MVKGKTLYDFNTLQYIETCFVVQHLARLRKWFVCTWGQCALCCCWVECSGYVSWHRTLDGFESFTSLLMFSLLFLSITGRRRFKFPAIVVDVSISPFAFISFCLYHGSEALLIVHVHLRLLYPFGKFPPLSLWNIPHYPW